MFVDFILMGLIRQDVKLVDFGGYREGMRIIADTHIHFYSCYDMDMACRSLAENLGRMGGDGVKVAVLAERTGCHYYADLKRGRKLKLGGDFEVLPSEDGDGLVIRGNDGSKVYLVPGRQIVTSENIAVLALTFDLRIPDYLPLKEVIKGVLDFGAVPVLSWAPGKWFFARGRLIMDIMDAFSPGQLLIGDTSLRPIGWAEPALMRRAAGLGFGVVAGSDPLPISGEEARLGAYASIFEGDFDVDNPVVSIRNLLTAERGRGVRAGRRCGLLGVVARLIKNAKSKKDV